MANSWISRISTNLDDEWVTPKVVFLEDEETEE
jgi:hypothetical protein